MKTKSYTFNEDEMIAIRDALVENYVRLRDHMAAMVQRRKEPTPYMRKMLRTLESLKDQFMDDCCK